MARAKKKRVGRPTGRKPLLNLRVEQQLLDRLKAAAEASGRTLAEESILRLGLSFTLQKQHTEQLQYEVGARIRAEDALRAAEERIEQLELLSLNVAEVVKQAVSEAFSRAGIKPEER